MNKALSATLVLYPLVVYFSLQYFGPRIVASLVLSMVLLRLLVAKSSPVTNNPVTNNNATDNAPWLLLAAIVATAGTMITGSNISLKLYPVMVNLILLVVFSLSLWRPPTIIERIARLQNPNLPPAGVAYTRKVTQVWCGFFIANGSIAMLTAFSSDQIWAIYNGCISYLLMGSIFTIEYVYRRLQVL